MRRRRPLAVVAAALLVLPLAGCNSGPHWTKPGAAASDATAAYDECQAAAGDIVEPENRINEDIDATRGGDWQRSRVGLVENEAMAAGTKNRTAALVDSCMQAKGYTQPPH